MINRASIIAFAALCVLTWSSPASTQLRFSVDSADKCEATAQRIVDKVYYYKKLRLDQRFYNRVRHEVVRNASYHHVLNDLNGWARREPARLASQCRGIRPTPSRPWTYEFRE